MNAKRTPTYYPASPNDAANIAGWVAYAGARFEELVPIYVGACCPVARS